MIKYIVLLVLLSLTLPMITGCIPDTSPAQSSVQVSQPPSDHSLDTVKAAYEEIICELFDKRQLYDTVSMTGYSGTEIIISFYSQSDPEIISLVQSMIDGKIPGVTLVVNENVPAPTPLVPPAPQIAREKAIELASQTLPSSIVDRSIITAELHGWYWEVTFGNLNAKYEELTPWPLKPPPPFPGTTIPPDTNIYQGVYIIVDAQTGDANGVGVITEPETEPYISREHAVLLARETLSNIPDDTHWGISPDWLETAVTEAYLRGDKWIVILWNESSDDRHYSVTLNAVTGENVSAEGKYTPPGSVTPPIFP